MLWPRIYQVATCSSTIWVIPPLFSLFHWAGWFWLQCLDNQLHYFPNLGAEICWRYLCSKRQHILPQTTVEKMVILSWPFWLPLPIVPFARLEIKFLHTSASMVTLKKKKVENLVKTLKTFTFALLLVRGRSLLWEVQVESTPSHINLLPSLLEVMQLHHFKPRHLLSFVQHLRQSKPNLTDPFSSAAVHVTSNKRITLLHSVSTFFPQEKPRVYSGQGKVAEALRKEKVSLSKHLSLWFLWFFQDNLSIARTRQGRHWR